MIYSEEVNAYQIRLFAFLDYFQINWRIDKNT